MERVLGEGVETSNPVKGSELEGTPYEPPFPYISDYGERGHTVLPADFVTTEDGTGIVHTAIAFGEDDFDLGERFGLTLQNPVRPDGTFDERIEPFAGRDVREADAGHRRGAARQRPAVPGRGLRALLPALLALRHAAHLLRQVQLVRAHHGRQGRAAGRQRDRRPGIPTTSSTGASATGWRTTWTGRCRASATGARRCRSGDPRTARRWCASGSREELRELGAEVPEDLHRPLRGRRDIRARRQDYPPRARPDRRVVGLRLHALRPVARAVREPGGLRGALPGRLHLRGARPDARLVLLAARRLHAAVRPLLLRDRAVPRADPRRRGAEDVQVARATWCPRGRCSTPTAPTPSAGTTSPRSSRGTATASRWRPWASRCASSSRRCGTPTASSCCTPT